MGTELEIKMRVEDLASTREALKLAGAVLKGRTKEVNHFFDRPDQALLKTGSGLRIRMETPIDGSDQRTRVTFKGPRESANAPRREVEFWASDYACAVELFEAVGFTRVLSFEKIRESWELGDCEIELDELPELGRFVEIEGHAMAAIEAVRERLGLTGVPLVKEGYAEMMAKKK